MERAGGLTDPRRGRDGSALLAAVAGGLAVLLPSAAAAQPLPDTVRIRDPGLHPEGVEWDATGARFLVGSVTRGTVMQVEDDGSHRPLVEDRDLVGSIGIHIDRANGRLLVANADPRVFSDTSAAGIAKLGVYDLASGERVRMVDLGGVYRRGRHFANDVTVGPDGTAYVTDSFSPVIYRVDPDGVASVLVEVVPSSGDTQGRLTLNGIEYHPDGYLLVAVAGRRRIVRYRPPEAGGTERVRLGDDRFQDVELPEPISADGLVLHPDGSLVAVATTFSPDGERGSEVVALGSTDGWRSAEILARAPAGGATTATVREGEVYVVNPHFEGLGGNVPFPAFEIYRVRLQLEQAP